MYQVNYKYITPLNNQKTDCVFYHTSDVAKEAASEMAESPNISDVQIVPHAINSRCEANVEIHRLRKLLSQSYMELQQLKRGYNEFIQREKAATS